MKSFTEFFSRKGIYVWNILSDNAIEYSFACTNKTPLAGYKLEQTTGIAVLLPYRIITNVDTTTPHNLVTIGSFAAYNYYHFLVRTLQALSVEIRTKFGLRRRDIRVAVNSKLPEKASAVLAHLGWIGKSGLLVNPVYGSAVLIGLLLFPKIDALHRMLLKETVSTNLITEPLCGSCTACIDACPTHALDNGFCKELCLQYWMSRGGMPENLKVYRGNRLYGCDTCIKECPYTWRAQCGDKMEKNYTQWDHWLKICEQWKQWGHSCELFTYIESQLTEGEKRPGHYLPLEMLVGMSVSELKGYFKGTAFGFSWIPLEDFKLYARYLIEKNTKGCKSD